MTSNGIRLILTRDSLGEYDGWERRREGASYSPGTALRRVLADPVVAGFPDLRGESAGRADYGPPDGGDPAEPGGPDDPRDRSRSIWLLKVVEREGESEGVVVGVTSRSSGLLLGPRKRDAIADLSADQRHLVVHFCYAEETRLFGSAFDQLLGSRRRSRRTPRGSASDPQ